MRDRQAPPPEPGLAEQLRAVGLSLGTVELTGAGLSPVSVTGPDPGQDFWAAAEPQLRAERNYFLVAHGEQLLAVRAGRLGTGRWALCWTALADRWVDDAGRRLLPPSRDGATSVLLATDGTVLAADTNYPAVLGTEPDGRLPARYWPDTMPADAAEPAEKLLEELEQSRSLDRVIGSAVTGPSWFRIQAWHARQGGGGQPVLVLHIVELGSAKLDRRSVAAQIVRDPLTDLFNRRAFFDLAALPPEATATFTEVLVVDIRRFKRVNDLWGQQIGDRCLIETAGWLRSIAAERDVLFRLDGSRFVLLCTADSTADQQLRASSERTVQIGGRRILLSLQAGSSRRSPGTSLLAAAEEAEVALTVAKDQAWRTVVPWTAQISHSVVEVASAENAVQQAVLGGHEAVLFQPLVNVARRRVGGVESLLRLGGPASRVPTDQVLATSHRLGITPQFATRVYDRAFAEGLTLQSVFPDCLLGVNVSREFLSTGLAIDTIVACARRAGVRLEQVVVELTEDVAAGLSTEQLIGELRRGADLGMQMMIDDFGRGETSLSVLRKLPLAGVKLDKSLLPVEDDERDWDFVAGVVAMVGNFSGRLIAEGIETELQSRRLREIGVDIQQGYFFGQPETSQYWLAHGFTLPDYLN